MNYQSIINYIIIIILATILYLPACLLERLQTYRNWWLDRAGTRETDGHNYD